MKIYYLLALSLLFLLPFVSSENQFLKEGQAGNILFSCSDNGVPCSATTNCNLTSYYPNNTLFLDKVTATNRGNGEFIYSLTDSQTRINGVYNTFSVCWSGAVVSQPLTFQFEITPTGTQSSDNIQIGLLIVLLFLSGLFCWVAITFDSRKWLIKSALFMASLLIMIIAVNIGINFAVGDRVSRLMTAALIVTVSAVGLFFIYIIVTYLKGLMESIKDSKKSREDDIT